MAPDIAPEHKEMTLNTQNIGFDFLMGTVLEKDFLAPATDLQNTEHVALEGRADEARIQDQVWIKTDEGKEVCLLLANASSMMAIGDKLSLLHMDAAKLKDGYVVMYNHGRDQHFYLQDVDDVIEEMNIVKRSKVVETIWLLCSLGAVGAAAYAVLTNLPASLGQYALQLAVVLGIDILLQRVLLPRGTLVCFAKSISLIAIFWAILAMPTGAGTLGFMYSLLAFGGLPALSVSYILYKKGIEKHHDRLHVRLLNRWHKMLAVDEKDVEDNHAMHVATVAVPIMQR